LKNNVAQNRTSIAAHEMNVAKVTLLIQLVSRVSQQKRMTDRFSATRAAVPSNLHETSRRID
jgi:hypothetical protein